ncbi:MAG: CsbD family protein [Capsulimonadaceae bacterium]
MSNKNVIDGKLKQVEGKIQDAFGDLTGKIGHDVKGKVKQVEGRVQEIYGRVEGALKQAHDEDVEDHKND